MSRANFTPIPAKPTFGSKQNNLYASDYIANKKIKYHINNSCSNSCNNLKTNTNTFIFNYPSNYQTDMTQGNLLLFNKYRYPVKNNNTSNLNRNLYTSLDLKNVNVVQKTNPSITPTTINPSATPFYENYIIDSSGVLFGNTECGINNYVSFQVINM